MNGDRGVGTRAPQNCSTQRSPLNNTPLDHLVPRSILKMHHVSLSESRLRHHTPIFSFMPYMVLILSMSAPVLARTKSIYPVSTTTCTNTECVIVACTLGGLVSLPILICAVRYFWLRHRRNQELKHEMEVRQAYPLPPLQPAPWAWKPGGGSSQGAYHQIPAFSAGSAYPLA
ncbi:hypothetical protein M427DRAFT_313710 [Gonapodya prolifera JEL478]|uniref:Uncharacterized protein n=1 Tax=Gonapodya prolifera (strain JEL478) TaxID=1344416 RepID=A0A139AWU0_GONPJ|nr:hypothetical protein M427DRAFT_313710 [Gonapodya prolifera JEL478]|eukprot:KXS21212.1 hypothetical protein M427DRAFT_313710 [Gonapodya prolifera JEL478]